MDGSAHATDQQMDADASEKDLRISNCDILLDRVENITMYFRNTLSLWDWMQNLLPDSLTNMALCSLRCPLHFALCTEGLLILCKTSYVLLRKFRFPSLSHASASAIIFSSPNLNAFMSACVERCKRLHILAYHILPSNSPPLKTPPLFLTLASKNESALSF